jgi:nucleoid DNA-binding protein
MARRPAKKKAAAKKKKAPTRKTAAKRRPARKKQAALPKVQGVKQKFTKTGILNEIAENTDLSRKQVQSVLDELETLIHRHIKKRSVGEFTLPGLLKIRQVRRPATKRRMGRNPATGEEIVIGPKPASTRVRVTALKKLKQMVL